MNLLGKIFTVLIFVMSIVFMSLALMVFATHRQWREAAIGTNPKSPGLKTQLEQEKAKVTQLQADIELLRTKIAQEQAARAYALAGLESKRAQLEEQLKGKEDDLRNAQGDLTAKNAILATIASTQQKLQEENDELRVTIKVAQTDRDTLFTKAVALLDEAHAAKDIERVLRERQEQLVQQVAALNYAVRLHGIDINLVSLNAPPPPLDGVVLKVNPKDFLEISLGSDDGLKEGHTMEVFRDALYLGKVVIMKVSPNRAIGRVLPEYKRGPIKVDDRVATKLGKLG